METQLTFGHLHDSFSGEGKLTDETIVTINGPGSVELLRILPSGTVIAPNLESASEAGKVFVEAIRGHLANFPIYKQSNLK